MSHNLKTKTLRDAAKQQKTKFLIMYRKDEVKTGYLVKAGGSMETVSYVRCTHKSYWPVHEVYSGPLFGGGEFRKPTGEWRELRPHLRDTSICRFFEGTQLSEALDYWESLVNKRWAEAASEVRRQEENLKLIKSLRNAAKQGKTDR